METKKIVPTNVVEQTKKIENNKVALNTLEALTQEINANIKESKLESNSNKREIYKGKEILTDKESKKFNKKRRDFLESCASNFFTNFRKSNLAECEKIKANFLIEFKKHYIAPTPVDFHSVRATIKETKEYLKLQICFFVSSLANNESDKIKFYSELLKYIKLHSI